MTPRVTPIDVAVMGYIQENFTYEEMAQALGNSAKSGAYRRVEKLIRMALVEKTSLKSRSRRLTPNGRRVFNRELAAARKTASI
ncbi:MAG: hypothetical protein ACRD2L_06495 [Terriglobia bacterium]